MTGTTRRLGLGLGLGGWAAFFLASFAWAQAAEAVQEVVELRVSERRFLPVIIFNPTAAPASLRQSAIVDALDDALQDLTALRAVPVDAGTRECEGDLKCIAQLVARSGVSVEANEATPLALGVWLQTQRDRPHRLLSMLWSQQAALAPIAPLEDGSLPTGMERDAAVWERAVLFKSPPADLANSTELRAWARDLVGALQPMLQNQGFSRPFGSAEIRLEVEGATLELDGKVVGQSGAQKTILINVPVGGHELIVTHPSYAPMSCTLRVVSGARVVVEVELLSMAGASAASWVVYGAGGAAAAAGIGVGIAAALLARSRSAECVALVPGAACPTQVPVHAGSGIGQGTSTGSGPALLPVAVALGSGGVATVVTKLFMPDDSALGFVIPLAAGLLAAGVGFGVSTALVSIGQ